MREELKDGIMHNGDFTLEVIGQISRIVKDINAASIWYQEKLGLRLAFFKTATGNLWGSYRT